MLCSALMAAAVPVFARGLSEYEKK
jgi:hypothetical protein